jgi:hypothetical protein
MSDIFLAHASDIIARGELELVPLLHEGGVEMLLIGSMSRISITDAPMASVADISGPEIAAPASGLTVTSAA